MGSAAASRRPPGTVGYGDGQPGPADAALLECAWPVALETAQQPFKPQTWVAALLAVIERDGGELDRTRRLGAARFEYTVPRQILKQGKQKPCLRIVRKLFAALADPTGVRAHRPGALERVGFLLTDWQAAAAKLAEVEIRMVAVLDQLHLTTLATSIVFDRGAAGGKPVRVAGLGRDRRGADRGHAGNTQPMTVIRQTRSWRPLPSGSPVRLRWRPARSGTQDW
jgi:hypothetical protein